MGTVVRVISGGQTGADIGGLRGAKRARIPTGGWMPFGCETEIGPRRAWLKEFGLKECPTPGYPARTYLNVRESDGTMRFAADFSTAGERCTAAAIKQYRRPSIDVDVTRPLSCGDMDRLLAWLEAHHIRILNVAGNRETTYKGIGKLVAEMIYALVG